MKEQALGTNISDRYERATNILRSLQPGSTFSLSQRIRLRRLRQSSQVLNKSASHLAYILALKEELKMGIEEDQQPLSPPEIAQPEGKLGQVESLEGARNRSTIGELPSPKPKSRWRVYAPNSLGARRAWLMKKERRYGVLENTGKIEPVSGSLESSVQGDCIVNGSKRRRGFHSTLMPIPFEKRGPNYLNHTMSLYMNEELDSKLSTNKEEGVAKGNQNNKVHDGTMEDDGECLEIRSNRHSRPSPSSKDSKCLNNGKPSDIPSTGPGERTDAEIERNGALKKENESGLVIIWNSFRSNSDPSKLVDPDAKTVHEYSTLMRLKTAKERRRTVLHLDTGIAIERTPESLNGKYSVDTIQRSCLPSECRTYIASDPNPFQKPSRPSVVLPSNQRSNFKEAPDVRSPTGYPTSQTQLNHHQEIERKQRSNSNLSFLGVFPTAETANRSLPNYSRPLVPKRLSSEKHHKA